MTKVVFNPVAVKDLRKLPTTTQERILNKIRFFSTQLSPLQFSKPLVKLPPATHRFRIGDYRIAFFIENDVIYIERIRHRREVYR